MPAVNSEAQNSSAGISVRINDNAAADRAVERLDRAGPSRRLDGIDSARSVPRLDPPPLTPLIEAEVEDPADALTPALRKYDRRELRCQRARATELTRYHRDL